MSDPDPALRPEKLPEDSDRALRPQGLEEFIGQQEARANLRVAAGLPEPEQRRPEQRVRALGAAELREGRRPRFRVVAVEGRARRTATGRGRPLLAEPPATPARSCSRSIPVTRLNLLIVPPRLVARSAIALHEPDGST